MKNEIEEKQKEIKSTQEEIDFFELAIEQKQEEIDNFELNESDYEESFCDMLDECYEGVFNLLPSKILLECDPIQYNCALSDYVDSLDILDDENYIGLQDDLDELENELVNQQDDLDELVSDLDELESKE